MSNATRYGLVGGFCALALVAVMMHVSTSRFLHNNARVNHSHRVIEHLSTLDGVLHEMQADKRAYGLTGDEAHLANLDALRTRLDESFQHLKRLTSDNPTQQAHLDTLEPLLLESAHLRAGIAINADIEGVLETMRSVETSLLASHELARTNSLTWERVIQFGALTTSMAIFGVTFARLRRENRRRVDQENAARQSEALVNEANRFLDSIVENIPNMVFVKDAEHLRFVRFNRAGERLLGAKREDLIGKSDRDLFPASQAEHFQSKDRQVLTNGVAFDIPEEPIDTPAGSRWLHTKKIPIHDEYGQPRYLLGISEDITERKQMADRLRALNDELEQRVQERTAALERSEHQLRHSQKLEAIGRLAGGIAHDFNNLLSVILSYTEMMVDDLPETNPMRGDLVEVNKAGRRAADLTRQLLAFSRQQVLAPRILELDAVVSGMDKLLRRVIGEDIELRLVAGPRLDKVKVDPGQIEQVIMNLVVNARDAMPRGGRLTLETANVELDATYASDHPEVSPGPHVMLAVSDTGVGMDKATQAQIFEPFFTTKETGKGTGLGLSTVFGIVRQHGGSIWVYSELGAGTSFKVYLPSATGSYTTTSGVGLTSAKPRGSETILLVEDEEQVRVLARGILSRAGYQVLEATNGEDAIALCKRFSGAIHLVVTDVVMPAMGGRELIERLCVERPETKALFMSGYTDDTVVHHGILEEEMAFLQKPITPELLLRKVREVLGHPTLGR